MSTGSDYRALISITTCRRLKYLRRYLPHFARFCADDQRFRLLVSLDGTEADVIDFCQQWAIPLIYSDDRGGVGMSKNRVLERFPGFDYYFFLEDDVELVDGSVFPTHVDLARASGIHHFSLFVRGGARKVIGSSVVDGRRIVHCLYGGADFNFFTAEGIKQVGGWHPLFATYRRFGHTEHSYRLFRRGLAPAPFNVVEDLDNTCIWHFHPPVTSVPGIAFDSDQVALPERELIDRALDYVPLQTCSVHHFNGVPFGELDRLASTLDTGERYPLLADSDRREARSAYYVWRSETAPTATGRVFGLLAGAYNWPSNPSLRHMMKSRLSRLGGR